MSTNLTKNLKIRRARKQDARELSKLAQRIIQGTPYYSHGARTLESQRYGAPKIRKRMQLKNYLNLVAEHDGMLVGFCAGYGGAGLFYIDWIGADRRFRRKGVGSGLLSYLEHCLHKRGGTHKILGYSRTNNKQSIQMLTKEGYKKICKVTRHAYLHDYYFWEKFI